MDQDNNNPLTVGIPLRAEEIGFGQDQLIECACGRTNPPNRLKCLYCGAALELTDEQAKSVAPSLRRLEEWESGFNVIVRAGPDANDAAASFGQIERDVLTRLREIDVSLPVARVETQREAEIVADRFGMHGWSARIVSDDELAADKPPTRLRGIEFDGDRLVMISFNTSDVTTIGAADIALIVTGAIVEKSVESTEKRKKGETKIVDATETASDELILDIYTSADPLGWRVMTKGFDFSCLGAEKALLARENIGRLVARIASSAPNGRVIENYAKVRHLLASVWEVEQRRDSKGLTRQRFGKFDLSNVASTTNQTQFTKYSRLQRHLI